MIRITFHPGKLKPDEHDVIIGEKLVASMRAAGIPVKASAFCLRGVDRGQLIYEQSGEEHSYTWREGSLDTETNWDRTVLKTGAICYKSGRHFDDEL